MTRRATFFAVLVPTMLAPMVISCGDTAPTNPGPDGPTLAPRAIQPVLVDYDNAGDASDLLVRFLRQSPDEGVAEYRAMIIPEAQAAAFDTAAARAVPSSAYVALPASSAASEIRFDPGTTDVNGDAITDEQSYAARVYSAPTSPGPGPDISESSNAVTLAVTNLVRTLTATIPAGSGGLDVDAAGNIYTADFGTNLGAGNTPGTRVHKVTAEGQVSVFATGLQGASGNDFDSQGNLMQSNIAAGTISRISPDGSVSTFATGLRGPVGINVVENDTLYVTNCTDHTLDRIDPEGVRETWVSGAPLSCPNGIARGDDGNVYVSNFNDGRVIRVTPTGDMSVLATLPGNNNAHLLFGHGLLYVVARSANQLYTVGLDGTVTLLAGSGTRGGHDGAALTATLSRPNDVALSPDGRILYFNDVANTTDATGALLHPVVVRMVLLER